MKPVTLRSIIRRAARRCGYDIWRIGSDNGSLNGDILRLLRPQTPIVFDVGANRGQSIEFFKFLLPQSTIHAFEPSPSSFRRLTQSVARYNDVIINNVGVSALNGSLTLNEYDSSEMSSFLRLGEDGWGQVVNRVSVPVLTLDSYCADRLIPYISLLKVDTQGYDLKVMEGAAKLLSENRVGLVLIEMNFAQLYQSAATFPELFQFFIAHGFRLVNFYRFHLHNGLAGWCDALFYAPDAIAQDRA